jgi:hypothetical protein
MRAGGRSGRTPGARTAAVLGKAQGAAATTAAGVMRSSAGRGRAKPHIGVAAGRIAGHTAVASGRASAHLSPRCRNNLLPTL